MGKIGREEGIIGGCEGGVGLRRRIVLGRMLFHGIL